MSEARQYGVTSSTSTLVVIGNKIDQYPRVVTEQQVRFPMIRTSESNTYSDIIHPL